MATVHAMAGSATWPSRARRFYERHERALQLAFFAGGFVVDALAARAGVDHAIVVVQQVVYLGLIGTILHFEVVRGARPAMQFPRRLEALWAYRSLTLHFCLGTLTNLYSIFFLMSASVFSTGAFVVLLLAAVAANEMKAVRRSGVDIKVALFVLCVFCYFSLSIPLVVGRVGVFSFAMALVATVTALGLFYLLLWMRLGAHDLNRRLLLPGLTVSACFLLSYLGGIIPPVPIAAKKMGVYHKVERQEGVFALYRDGEPRTFWQAWEQEFVARPGDQPYVFAAVYSPARFDDRVFMRWSRRTPSGDWATSDRLPLAITGGREGGFRAFTTKQNYTAGRWKVSLETDDGREISRLSFTIRLAEPDSERVLVRETY